MSDVTTELAMEASDKTMQIARLKAENAMLREQLAKARDPQRIGGTADPESFVYAIEQLREFRWQHATNDEEAIPYINNVADAHERENAKLRELCKRVLKNCYDAYEQVWGWDDDWVILCNEARKLDDLTTTITVHPFRHGTEKEAALKPLEEASEAREAAQQMQSLLDVLPMLVHSKELDELVDNHRVILADEIADTITACVNLAARYGLDLQAAIDRVEERNRERGRYA